MTQQPKTTEHAEHLGGSQWISLLYRRLQKIEQIEPDHCDRYQNNHI